jgi:hypothetical protein
MAENIEHRQPRTLIDAYKNTASDDCCNFALFCGAELRISYTGGNVDEAIDKLQIAADQIQDSGTNATYKLRIYDNKLVERGTLNSKSPYLASCTFCFGGMPNGGRDEHGNNIYLQRQGQQAAAVGSSELTQLTALVKQQQEVLNRLLLQKEEDKIDRLIEAIEAKNTAPVKEPWYDRIGNTIAENPSVLKDLIGVIREAFSPIPQQAPGRPHYQTINGTNNMQTEPQAAAMGDQDEQDQDIDPVLLERYTKAINALEERFGTENLVNTLEAIARMSDSKINALKVFM